MKNTTVKYRTSTSEEISEKKESVKKQNFKFSNHK